MIEGRAPCETAMAETTTQNRRSSQQFRRSANSPPEGPAFESLSAQQRRSTLCPAELDRINAPGQLSESSFEEEKMLFDQSIRGRVSMTPGGKPRPCRGLARGRMHRFVSKVSDDLRFRDVLWRSTVFSMYTAEERRRFAFPEKERRFQEDRGSSGWFSLDGRLLNAESATSRDRIGGDLSCEEALAWGGFSPLQRVLIVAIAAAAAANSKKGVEIKPAERSFDDRDQALNLMRHKLNNLWDRISSLHDQSGLRNASGCETRGQGDIDVLRSWKGKTGNAEKIPLESTHAPCAAAILELKRRTEHMIEKEVSNVMVAFASVLEKVEALEIYGSTQEGRQNKAQGVALGDLKTSVEKASAQITSLQMSLSDIWHALLPEALCAINISPSELEHYLDKAKKESSMLFPSRRFNIQAWRQWLNTQEHASEATFIPVLQDETGDDAFFKMLLNATEQEERRFSDISDWSASVTSFSDNNIWHSAEADVASAIGAAGKSSMDKIAEPLDVQNPGFNDYSQEVAMEKSLGELEIASTKVANLESQLTSLKEYLKVCETKRKDAEEKLAEAVQQGIKNRLNFAAKEEEIACLWKECKQKDAALKEITLAAQKSKDTSDKRLAVMEDICKKKNASIMRLKEDMIAMEEKVSEVMRRQTPPSSKCNSECSLPLVISNNFLFDMEIPSPPDGPRKVLGLKTIEDQYLAANEYASSSSQGYNETRRRSSGQSSASSPTSVRFRWNSTGTDKYGYHSSKVNSCQSVMSNDLLFDMPSSPDSPRNVLGLKTTEDQDLAANEYACSSSQGNSETRQISSGQSSASSTTSGRFRKNSTGTDKNGYHSSKVNSGQSSWSKKQLGKSSADVRYMNENTKSGPSSPRKVNSSISGSVLSGVDTNANSKSKRSSSDSEGLQKNAGNNKNNKPKDITRKKRWL